MLNFFLEGITDFFSSVCVYLEKGKEMIFYHCDVERKQDLSGFWIVLFKFYDMIQNFICSRSNVVCSKFYYDHFSDIVGTGSHRKEYVQKWLKDLKEEDTVNMTDLCRKYGFPKPLNPHMECVILMYHENCTVMFQILIGIIVYLIVALFLFTNRSLKDVQKTSKHVEYLIDFGFVWLPTAVIFNLAGMGVGYILHLDYVAVNLKTSLTVEVMGHQWYWWYTLDADTIADQFQYLNSFLFNEFLNNHLLIAKRRDIEIELRQFLPLEEITRGNFLAVNLPMVLPVKEHIRFYISAKDVIHSWTIPQLGVKVDALPGRINQFFIYSYYTGVYFGMCSELCGVYHAFMPICLEFQKGALFFSFCMFYRTGNEVIPSDLKKQFETAITLE